MRTEWRPPYDPLPWPSRWTWAGHAVWRFHSAVPPVPGRARRLSERGQIEFADLAGDHGAFAHPVRPGSIAANPLLAVGKVVCPRRFRLFVFLQRSGGKPVVAARAQHAAAERARADHFVAH